MHDGEGSKEVGDMCMHATLAVSMLSVGKGGEGDVARDVDVHDSRGQHYVESSHTPSNSRACRGQ